MVGDLDLALLRCFVTVAEEGSFTAAARHLNCTQSAVSMKVKRLEDQLGLRLFARTSRSMALTTRGETMLEDARRVLALGDHLVRRVRAPELEGHLRIGIVEYLAPRRLPAILNELRRLYPRIRFEVTLGLSADLMQAHDAGALDVTIASSSAADRHGTPFLVEPLVWVASKAKAPEPEEPVPLVLMPPPCAYRSAAVEALDGIGRSWREVLTATGFTGIQMAVEAGLGIGVLGQSSITQAMAPLAGTDSYPPLPDITLSVFTSPRIDGALCDAVTTLIADDIRRTREPS